MTAKTLLAFALLTLAGCARDPEAPPPWYTDQDIRERVFMECLRIVPAGPQATKYNDWAEVVDSCGDQANYIATVGDRYRRAQQVEE